MCGSIIVLFILLFIIALVLVPVFEIIGEVLKEDNENEKFIRQYKNYS